MLSIDAYHQRNRGVPNKEYTMKSSVHINVVKRVLTNSATESACGVRINTREGRCCV
jgi:hypothetical protein